MWQITLEVPDSMSDALRVSSDRLGAELLIAAAVKLCEAGRLSSGAAADLAGMPKPLFVERLGDYRVAAFRQDASELRDEAANA